MPWKLFTVDQDIQIRKLYLQGLSWQHIADKYWCYKQSIFISLKRTNTLRRSWGCPKWMFSLEKSRFWKWWIRITKWCRHIKMPWHHLARADWYVPEHRLVMENKIWRDLQKEEVVHHIDWNSLNNNPENLELFSNNGEHIKMHVKNTFKRNGSRWWKSSKNHYA